MDIKFLEQKLNVNKNSNDKNVNKKSTYFSSDEFNHDIQQNMSLLNKRKELEKNCDYNKYNVNNFNSLESEKDYLGCINKSCYVLDKEAVSNVNIKKKQTDFIFNKNLEKNKPNNMQNNIQNNNFLTLFINFIYILLITILLILTVFKKDSFYLLYLLVITLVYLFYKILNK
jgi:hypothetical protein